MARPLSGIDEAVAVVEDKKGAVRTLETADGGADTAGGQQSSHHGIQKPAAVGTADSPQKPVEGTKVKGSTVNREVSCLIHALNLAADEELCESAPRVKKER